MSNPFSSWTPEMVAAHNAKWGGKQHPKSEIIEANTHALKMSLPKITVTQVAPKKSIMNKMEQAWYSELKARGYSNIFPQGLTLRLGDDCRYSPDFFVAHAGLDGTVRMVCYETKGFMRDDARVKICAAAKMFPFIRFVLVTKKKGVWTEKEIGSE